jgi:phage/plasmid-associated DNA primase
MECNELPLLNEVNDAICRRIRVVSFDSKFVDRDVYNETIDKTGIFVKNPYYTTDDFRNKYKQALFEILRPYFMNFINNNLELPPLPKICKIKSSNYLACSDDIYEWFSTIFEKTNDNNIEPIKISEIYDSFTISSVFQNMSKIDKRKYSSKYFHEKIQTNLFLKKYYKPRDSYFNSKRITSPSIVGFLYIKNFTD